jgi:neopullulanase
MKFNLTSVFAFFTVVSFAQQFDHVEPPFWWVGMSGETLEIMFHNDELNLAEFKVDVQYPGVTVLNVTGVENPHFLFVTLQIGSAARAGSLPVKLSSGKKSFVYPYELRTRSDDMGRNQGFNSADAIYLIMPDRFANGDLANDNVMGMVERANRDNPEGRHGGDLRGITSHLPYLKDLGITTIWLTPVLENNQPKTSYHGYSITDLYKVDPRFGGNDAYVQFIGESHAHGLKVVKDMVMNHLGSSHWLMKDLPEKNWIHQFPEFTRTNYQSNVPSDPHRTTSDLKELNNGWFDITMPDLNQKNERLATYLIQNTLWWIEFAGIDGIRMDTYPYPDKDFMARWAKRVLAEFPRFNIVGEVWLNNSVAATAYWQKGMINADGFQSNLPSVTDFPFCFTVAQALNEPRGYETGLRRLYVLLSQDFIYPNAAQNVTFVDNHDMSRFFFSVGADVAKYKMGMAFLLTTRGIPAIYYGTELLMQGDGGYHPDVRKDFPGGWPGDSHDAFQNGKSAEQVEAYDFLRKLLQWRKNNPVIHSGALHHYIPHDNVYVYFRSYGDERVMVILNGNGSAIELSLSRFGEMLQGFSAANNVLNNQTILLDASLKIDGKSALIYELRK